MMQRPGFGLLLARLVYVQDSNWICNSTGGGKEKWDEKVAHDA